MIYLDNAATSWPKSPEVAKAMVEVLEHAGGNPGRSGHRFSVAAARVVNDVREEVASFFNTPDPLRVIFTPGATYSINLVLSGLLNPGDNVVTTSMEHNAVMRPLRNFQKYGVIVSTVKNEKNGTINLQLLEAAIKKSPRLVIVNHASNVTGTIAPIEQIARMAREKGSLVLIDAAQSAGAIPIDFQHLSADFLALSGHKGLLGPPGIGALVISKSVDLTQVKPLISGDTGSQSKSEEQPDSLPDKYESGTLNLPGIAGLGAGVRYLKNVGAEKVLSHERKLMAQIIDGLSDVKGVTLFGPKKAEQITGVLSFTINGLTVSTIGQRLDEEFGILCRVGLHCAPSAHHTIGTFPQGTVRLSPGLFTTKAAIEQTISAVKTIAANSI